MSWLPDPDRVVIEELEKRGDVGGIPRPIFIWLYGSEAELLLVACRLSAKGWLNTEPEAGENRWAIRAEREQSATIEAISSMVDEIHSIIENTSVDFDGWETSVERPH